MSHRKDSQRHHPINLKSNAHTHTLCIQQICLSSNKALLSAWKSWWYDVMTVMSQLPILYLPHPSWLDPESYGSKYVCSFGEGETTTTTTTTTTHGATMITTNPNNVTSKDLEKQDVFTTHTQKLSLYSFSMGYNLDTCSFHLHAFKHRFWSMNKLL